MNGVSISGIFSPRQKILAIAEQTAREKAIAEWVKNKFVEMEAFFSLDPQAQLLFLKTIIKGELRNIDPQLIGESRYYPTVGKWVQNRVEYVNLWVILRGKPLLIPSQLIEKTHYLFFPIDFLIHIVKVVVYTFRAHFYHSNVTEWQEHLDWIEGHIVSYWDAVDQNNISKVQALLEEFPQLINLNASRSTIGKTPSGVADHEKPPFSIIIEKGYLKLWQYLFNSPNLDPNLFYKRDDDGNTPLHLAVLNNRIQMASDIMTKRMELLKNVNNDGLNPLKLALNIGNFELASVIISSPEARAQLWSIGEDLDNLLSSKDDSGNNLLHLAVLNGQLSRAASLLTIAPNLLKERNKQGLNPLLLAYEKGQFKIFYQFLSSPVAKSVLTTDDFHYKKNNQSTHSLLYQCISKNHMEDAKNIATFMPGLLASPVYIKLHSTNALFLAYENEHYEFFSYCLTLADIECALYSSDVLRNTLLHRTTIKGQTQLAITIASTLPGLLKYINRAGEYPLQIAGNTNQWDLVNHFSTFQESHLSMWCKDVEGNTILHLAVIHHQLQAIATISKAQPSLVHEKNHAGQTPFFMAYETGQWPIVDLFFKTIEVMRSRDENGNSLLHQAIAQGKRQLAKDSVRLNPQLLEIANNENITPVGIAYEKDDRELFHYFLNFKEDATLDINWKKALVHRKGSLLTVACLKKDTQTRDFLAETFPLLLDLDAFCTAGDSESMEWLMTFEFIRKKLKKSVDQCDSNEEHPLVAAASSGNIEMIKYLIGLHPGLVNTPLSFEKNEEVRGDCSPFIVISRIAAQKAASDPDLAEKMAQIVEYIAELESFDSEIEYCNILIFELFNELIDKYDPIKFTLAKYVLQKFPKLANESAHHGLPFIHYALKLEKYDLVEFFFTIPGFDIQLLDNTDENGQNLLYAAFPSRWISLSRLLLQHAPHLLLSSDNKEKSPLISFATEREISGEDDLFIYFLFTLPEFQSAARIARCPKTGNTILHQLAAHLQSIHYTHLREWICFKNWTKRICKLCPELITIKNTKGQFPFQSVFNDKIDETDILEFVDIIPELSLVPDQQDKSGYYPIHYLARILSYERLLKACLEPYINERLVFEKREDFLYSVYGFLLRKDRNLKLDVKTNLALFNELDLRMNALSNEFLYMFTSKSAFTESHIEKYLHLVSDYSLMLRHYSETIIFDETLIARYVKVLTMWMLCFGHFSKTFSYWFEEQETPLSATLEHPNKKSSKPDLNMLKEFQEKFKDLQILFNFVQNFFSDEQKKTINYKRVIDSFNTLAFSDPENRLTEARKTTLNLIQKLDYLIESEQSKLAKKERKEIPFVELLLEEDREDSYQIVEYLRLHQNLTTFSEVRNRYEGIPFQQAYSIIFGIPKDKIFKLDFHSFGIQEGRDMRIFGMTFEVKILANDDNDNRALTQPEMFLNVLNQKVERLKQLPSPVKEKLLKDLELKNFKSLEEELEDLTADKIDKNVINHLREHEIAMNISLFGSFINQDLTAVHDRIEKFQLDPQNEGLFFTLADIQELYSLSMADMYELEVALKRKEVEIQNLQTLGITFEVKIFGKIGTDNRFLNQAEQLLKVLTQKAKKLEQLPLFVKENLVKDLTQKNFKSLEEELTDLALDKIDRTTIHRLREHETVMNISLFRAFISQDLTALSDLIEKSEDIGLPLSLVDIQEQYSLSMTNMYQLEETLEQMQSEQEKEDAE